MILGTLRDQLSYPRDPQGLSDSELSQVLGRVNLPDIVVRCGGFDRPLDFDKVLSVGEQQRLAFARVLLQKPRYVMMDEATSALDGDNEAGLYRQLQGSATTVVSVSHHPAVLPYHQQVLELTGDGGWRLCAAAEYQFDRRYLGD
jgi:putative ATP-binding cassette transporter